MSRDAEPKIDPKATRLFDKRTIERNIKKGLITRKDYEKHLKTLDDVAGKGLYGVAEGKRGRRRRSACRAATANSARESRRGSLKPRPPVRNLQGMASGDSKVSGFTVTDRRSFAEGGDAPEHASEEARDGTREEPPARASTVGDIPIAAFPPVDFHTFVLSLGSSALLHLGEIENPNDGVSQKDLPLAKHTIDILAMLEEKTKGNLTTAEEKLIESLLYDLRLRYVEATKPLSRSSWCAARRRRRCRARGRWRRRRSSRCARASSRKPARGKTPPAAAGWG